MEENKTHFPNRLRELRRRAGLSQKQVVARVGGLDVPRLARYERGQKAPSLMQAFRLSFFYQEPLQVIFPEVVYRIRCQILANRMVIRAARRRSHYGEEAP